MATTRIIPMHIGKGRAIAQMLTDGTDYGKNPEKTNQGELISAYACDPHTADAEFLLAKREYAQITGRDPKNDVIMYQVRQSFKPGEVTPEDANKIGYEFASRFLKGKHAFIRAVITGQKADAAAAHCREISGKMDAAQKRLTEIDVLRQHILNYAHTRDVFQQYKASGYSKKFLQEHQEEIDRHRAAKRAFNELGLKKLPSKKSLDMEYSQVLAEKKSAYAEYRDAQKTTQELMTHRENLRPYLAPQDDRHTQKKKEQDER